MGLHAILCRRADQVRQILVDGKVLYSGPTLAVNATISIDKPTFFGEEKREGGVVGSIDIAFGGPAQTANSYLTSFQPAPVPAYRGAVAMIWRQIYYGNAAIPRPWTVKVSTRSTEDAWQPSLAVIDVSPEWSDMNPIHILRDILRLNSRGTSGHTFGSTWLPAAQEFFDAGFGLSVVKRADASLDAVRREIEQTIDARVYIDRETGLTEVDTFDNDYIADQLPRFDDTNVEEWVEVNRPNPLEAPNQVTLVFSDHNKNGDNSSITVTNTARVNQVGRVNRERLERRHITTRENASRVAVRELHALGTAPATGVIRVDALAPEIHEGSLILLDSPRRRVNSMVARVVDIDEGGTTDFGAEVRFVEVRRKFVENIIIGEDYIPIRPTDPAPASPIIVEELPYRLAKFNLLLFFEGTKFEDPEASYINILAGAPDGRHIRYQIKVDDGGGYVGEEYGDFMKHGTLVAPVTRSATSITVTPTSAVASIVPNSLILLGGVEYVRVVSQSNGVVTIGRGCLDTVPVAHSAGAIVFAARSPESNEEPYDFGETLDVKLLTQLSGNLLALAAAPVNQVTMNRRALRPYPPANFKVEGSFEPGVDFNRTMSLTWAHRDRTAQTGFTIEDHTLASIGPEAGVTYEVRVEAFDAFDASLGYADNTALPGTATSHTFDGRGDVFLPADIFAVADVFSIGVPAGTSYVLIGVTALRDGYESHQFPRIRYDEAP